MLCTHGHISAGFFALTLYACNLNTTVLLQVCKVNFLNRLQIRLHQYKHQNLLPIKKIHFMRLQQYAEKNYVYLARIGCHKKKARGNVVTHVHHRII